MCQSVPNSDNEFKLSCQNIYLSVSFCRKEASKAANIVDVFINALTCSEFQDMLQRAAQYFWSWLGAE